MKEIRSAPIAAGDDMVLEGVAVVYDTPALIHDPIGDFYEVIARGALDGCDLSDVSLRIEHDNTRIPLARTPRTMQLTVDERGMSVRATLAGESPQARDVYEAVRRGDLKAMSFAFVVAEGGSTYDPRTNTRTITRISKVYECSIVEHAAYVSTSIEARFNDVGVHPEDRGGSQGQKGARPRTHRDDNRKDIRMQFNTGAESYNFYKGVPTTMLVARSEAIEAEIRSNQDADLSAISIELDGITAALQERVGPKVERRSIVMTAEGSHEEAQDSKEYRSAYCKYLLGRDLTTEERNAWEQVNKRSEFNTSADSGAVMPTTMLNEIVTKARDRGGIMGLARGFSMPSGIAIPIATPTGKASWHAEGDAVDSEKVSTTSVTFGGYEIVKILSISEKVRRMSISAFESYLMEELNESVLSCLAESMVSGDGDGEATGIVSGITWTDDANQLTVDESDFGWRNLVKLVGMMHRGYARNATFVTSNRAFYDLLMTLHDDNDRPLFVEDVKDGSQGRLLGKPVVIDDYMEDGQIILGDWRYYAYNLPEGIRLAVSEQSSFNRALIDYRALAIADAKPVLTDAFARLVVE